MPSCESSGRGRGKEKEAKSGPLFFTWTWNSTCLFSTWGITGKMKDSEFPCPRGLWGPRWGWDPSPEATVFVQLWSTLSHYMDLRGLIHCPPDSPQAAAGSQGVSQAGFQAGFTFSRWWRTSGSSWQTLLQERGVSCLRDTSSIASPAW